MTTGVRFCAAAIAVMTSVGAEMQVFRSRTDVVSVPVSVSRGNRPVANLALRDFQLFDDGVRQEIEEVLDERIPIDVTLVVDISGSTAGTHGRFERDVFEIGKMLDLDDRLRVITFGEYVHEVVPLGTPGREVRLPLTASGATALYDALIYPLVSRNHPGRRHLAVVLTDGLDSMSATSLTRVRTIARQSETALYAAITRPSPGPSSLSGPVTMRPPVEAVEQLVAVAELTGGRRIWAGVFSNSAVGPFQDALAEFRPSYLLRFRPSNPRPGWHPVEVRVTREGSYRVRARRGYIAD